MVIKYSKNVNIINPFPGIWHIYILLFNIIKVSQLQKKQKNKTLKVLKMLLIIYLEDAFVEVAHTPVTKDFFR